LDDYPFVERRHGGRVITFAAPSDHGNSLALRIGQLIGSVVARSASQPKNDNDVRQRRRNAIMSPLAAAGMAIEQQVVDLHHPVNPFVIGRL
jgi:hypothetical protein